MAAIATIFGGLVGYVLAMIAYFIIGTGLVVALAAWSIGGIGFVLLAMLAGRLSRADHSLPARA